MAVIVTLVLQLAGVRMLNESAVETTEFAALAKAAIWMVNHLGWGMLILTAFLILPTWLLFRYAPKHSPITLTCRTPVPDSAFREIMGKYIHLKSERKSKY